MTEPRNHGTTEGQGESSIVPLFQSGAIKKSTESFQFLQLIKNFCILHGHVCVIGGRDGSRKNTTKFDQVWTSTRIHTNGIIYLTTKKKLTLFVDFPRTVKSLPIRCVSVHKVEVYQSLML